MVLDVILMFLGVVLVVLEVVLQLLLLQLLLLQLRVLLKLPSPLGGGIFFAPAVLRGPPATQGAYRDDQHMQSV